MERFKRSRRRLVSLLALAVIAAVPALLAAANALSCAAGYQLARVRSSVF